MSNTTKKDEKEIASDIAAMESAINNLSYDKLEELLASKKAHEIENKTKELTAAKGIVASLEAQLEKLGVVTAPVAPVKRGRKIKNNFPPQAKAPKKGKGKRGAVGEAITAFVASKGKAGAKVAEIAAHLGTKPANVTAFFYAKGNRKKFKKVAPATFVVAK